MKKNWYLITFIIILQGVELYSWFPKHIRERPYFNDWNEGFFKHIRKLDSRQGSKEKTSSEIPLPKCSPPQPPPPFPKCPPPQNCPTPRPPPPPPNCPTNTICQTPKPPPPPPPPKCPPTPICPTPKPPPPPPTSCLLPFKSTKLGPTIQLSPIPTLICGTLPSSTKSAEKTGQSKELTEEDEYLTVKIPNYEIPSNISTYLQYCNGNWQWNQYVNFSIIQQWAQQFSIYYSYPSSFWTFIITNFPGIYAYTPTYSSVQLTLQINSSIITEIYQNLPSWGNYSNGIWMWPNVIPAATSSQTTTIEFTIPSEIIPTLQNSPLAQNLQYIDGSYQWPQNFNYSYWADYLTNKFGYSGPIWSFIIVNFPQIFSNTSNSVNNKVTVQVPSSSFDLINSSPDTDPSQLISLLEEQYGPSYNAIFWNFVINTSQYLQNGGTIEYPPTTVSFTIPSQAIQIIQNSGIYSNLFQNNDGSYSWTSDFDLNKWAKILSNETNYPVDLWVYLLNNYPSIFVGNSTISSVTITLQIPYWTFNVIQNSNLTPTQLASLLQSQNGNTIDFWNFLISITPNLQFINQNSGLINLPLLPSPPTPPPTTPLILTNLTFSIPRQVIQYIQQSDVSSYLHNSDGFLNWNSSFNLNDWSEILAAQTGYPIDFWAFILTNYLLLFSNSNTNNATLSFTVPNAAIHLIQTSTNNTNLINSLQNIYGQSELFWNSLISVDTYLTLQDQFTGYINLPVPLSILTTTATITTTTSKLTGGYFFGINVSGLPCSIVPYIRNSNLTTYLDNINEEGVTPYYIWSSTTKFKAWADQLAKDVGTLSASMWLTTFISSFPNIINSIVETSNKTNLTPADLNSMFNIPGCK